MKIVDYTTAGGKNLILEYIDGLTQKEQAEAYRIRLEIMRRGPIALINLDTRQLKGKLWEIKFYQNRIMYVLFDSERIYFLHACKKQKNKVERQELGKALRRAKEYGLI
ncbi:MAG: type II toxin-antitoxin system RelE/ParE family toxin [Clostridiales bacterium]|jgi:phage-related protein|nr:type II toxin-antitoxin system RelE/ParE family toxin [Clostridiales bacterium]